MKISRKELYDLVWSEPMTTVSKRFGLSMGLFWHKIKISKSIKSFTEF
jgi:hypothetical protein